MFEIHPDAKNNFDAKAASLADELREVSRAEKPPEEFASEVHVAATLTDKDIVGEIQESCSDYRGQTVDRFFTHEGKKFGLGEDGYLKLSKLAEAIQRVTAFRSSLSQAFIENSLFSWLRSRHVSGEDNESFIDFLTKQAQAAVKPVTVYVPVANLIVEEAFTFGGTTISNISKSLVDELSAPSMKAEDEQHREDAAKFFEDFRKKYQGYAAVLIELTCEPAFAEDFSIARAHEITELLGIYSGTVLTVDIKCISRIKGSENLAQATTITRQAPDSLAVKEQILDLASTRVWRISKNMLADFRKCGFSELSALAAKAQVVGFESVALNMATLYAKAAFTAEPMEKLVHVLSALESTLLKNESEPIQQNLGERLAIFTAKDLQDRKKIVKNVRAVYGMRSRYLHHGYSSDEMSELSTFFLNVWMFFSQLLVNVKEFDSKDAFLSAIDDSKLA